MRRLAIAAVLLLAAALPALGAEKPRARELGLVAIIGGTPGALDTITRGRP